jgi:hypothetical protein
MLDIVARIFTAIFQSAGFLGAFVIKNIISDYS